MRTERGDLNNLQRSQADILHALLNLENPPYDTTNEGAAAYQSFNAQVAAAGFNKNSDPAVVFSAHENQTMKKLYTQNTTAEMSYKKNNIVDGKTMKVNFE